MNRKAITSFSVVGLVATATARALAAQGDPFANPSPGGSAAAAASANPGATANVNVNVNVNAVDPACAHITEAVCQSANTMMIATAVGYVAVTALLFLLLRAWMNKRGTGSPALRLIAPMLGAGAVSGLLVGLDPARGVDAKCCLASGALKAQMLLQDSAMGRAFLLGAVPAIVVYFLVVFVVGIIRR